MSYWQNHATANAAQDEQKDKSDYIKELADHLDVDTNALKAALSDASEAVVKALVVELGPGGGEAQDGPSANARIADEYPDGTIDGRSRDVVNVATARERVQTLVANSVGSGSDDERKIGDMPAEEVIDALGEKFVTEDSLEALLDGDESPSANAGDGDGEDVSEYSDGTIGSDLGAGGSTPTANATPEQRDTGSDDPADYGDGTIGGI